MTPFGARVRELRRAKGVTQADMATALGVSGAYLSALEHGRRGRPSWYLLQRMIGYLGIIWDEAEELERLADLSHPRVTVETGGLSSRATFLANHLSRTIGALTPEEIEQIISVLDMSAQRADMGRG